MVFLEVKIWRESTGAAMAWAGSLTCRPVGLGRGWEGDREEDKKNASKATSVPYLFFFYVRQAVELHTSGSVYYLPPPCCLVAGFLVLVLAP